MQGITRNLYLITVINVDICQIGCEHHIVVVDCGTEQQRAAIPEVRNEFGNVTRALEKNPLLSHAKRLDVPKAIEHSKHFPVL